MNNFLVVWWIVTWHLHQAPPPAVDPYVGKVKGALELPAPWTMGGMPAFNDLMAQPPQWDSETELFSKHFKTLDDADAFLTKAPTKLKQHMIIIDERTGEQINAANKCMELGRNKETIHPKETQSQTKADNRRSWVINAPDASGYQAIDLVNTPTEWDRAGSESYAATGETPEKIEGKRGKALGYYLSPPMVGTESDR